MKRSKILAVILTGIALFSLVSCGAEGGEPFKKEDSIGEIVYNQSAGFYEQKAEEMIKTTSLINVSSMWNNSIEVKYADKNVTFECTATVGSFLVEEQEVNTVTLKSEDSCVWADTENAADKNTAYVEIIAKSDQAIVGYGVVHFCISEQGFKGEVIKSAILPKINGQYQTVEEEQVKTAMRESEKNLSMCECVNDDGKFYSLSEAYENGWLSVENLKDISYYYRGNNGEEYEPAPKDPEILSRTIETEIKKTYLNDLQKVIPSAQIDDIKITLYYGTYNDCVVVKVWDDLIKYDLVFSNEEIGGVLFNDYCEREIYVWKKQCIYDYTLQYGAVLFDNAQIWMNKEFLESNKTIHLSSDDNLPVERVILIQDDVTFKETFDEFLQNVDFNKKVMIVYLFTDIYASRECRLENISVRSNILNISVLHDMEKPNNPSDPAPPVTSMPTQRCLTMLFDKVNFEKVNFILNYL